MKRREAIVVVLGLAFTVGNAAAQKVSYAPAIRQIAAAITPLPAPLRGTATVLGYDPAGKLVTLRKGSGDMICLADDPHQTQFHVACYHRSLEPFMARGRALRLMKKSHTAIDSARLADVKAGRIAMPSKPAALYQYFAPRDSVDAATGAVNGASYLYVVYIPYVTPETSGLTANPLEGGPWIMYPGKPWAHIMIAPQKTARITY